MTANVLAIPKCEPSAIVKIMNLDRVEKFYRAQLSKTRNGDRQNFKNNFLTLLTLDNNPSANKKTFKLPENSKIFKTRVKILPVPKIRPAN